MSVFAYYLIFVKVVFSLSKIDENSRLIIDKGLQLLLKGKNCIEMIFITMACLTIHVFTFLDTVFQMKA